MTEEQKRNLTQYLATDDFLPTGLTIGSALGLDYVELFIMALTARLDRIDFDFNSKDLNFTDSGNLVKFIFKSEEVRVTWCFLKSCFQFNVVIKRYWYTDIIYMGKIAQNEEIKKKLLNQIKIKIPLELHNFHTE